MCLVEHVKTRRLNPNAETWAQAEAIGTPKYLSVTGGHPVLFGGHTLERHRIAVLTEGEFDCLLAWQEAGTLMGAITLGSCSKGLDTRLVRVLAPLVRILVAYDADADGQRGAARLTGLSARMRRIQVPGEANDITDYAQQGGDVVAWLAEEAGRHWPLPFEPARTEEAA